MAQEKTITRTVGLTFLEGLTLVFIHAKLFNVILWSWWFVLLPIILQFSLGLLSLGLTFGMRVVKKLSDSKELHKRQQLLMEAMMRQAEPQSH